MSTLFSPISNTPQTALIGLGMLHLAPDLMTALTALLSILAILVPPLVAVIVGARLGDSGKISFLSWFLTAAISTAVYLLLIIIGQGLFWSPWTLYVSWFGLFAAILYFIIPGVVNGFFYGCFSFLFSKD